MPMPQPPTPRRTLRGALALVAGALALLLAPQVAGATVFSGALADPTGDELAGGPSTDLVAVTASYDSAGSLAAQVTLAGPPPATSSSVVLLVAFGTTQPDGDCGGSIVTLGGTDDATANAIWKFQSGGANAATKSVAGNVVGFSAAASALAAQPLDCVLAVVGDVNGNVIDVAGPGPLSAPAPQPTPGPAPTAAPTAGPPVSTPTPPAALTLSVPAVAPQPRNRWIKLRATVTNSGGAAAAGGRLKLQLPRGVQAKPASPALGTLAAGATKTVTLRLRLTRRAAASSSVKLSAGAAGSPTARQTLVLQVQRRVAKLTLTVAGTTTVAPGKATTIKATIANVGLVAARGVKLSVSGRGVTRTPASKRLGTLRAHRTRTVKVTLKLARTAKAPATVSFLARGAHGLLARQKLTLSPPASATPGAPGTPAADPNDLAPSVYVHYKPGVLGISDDTWTTYAFTGPGWVLRGLSSGGVPSCSARTAADATSDGCVPYSYDAATNALTLDGQPATLSADKDELTVGDESYFRTPPVAAGARLSVELEHISIFGFFPNQVSTTTWLTLTPDGQFAFSSDTLGTTGFGGNISTAVTAISPDKRGTYTVLPNSAIQLNYANGTQETRTILINGYPSDGSAPDPQKQGLLLDSTYYFSSDD